MQNLTDSVPIIIIALAGITTLTQIYHTNKSYKYIRNITLNQDFIQIDKMAIYR